MELGGQLKSQVEGLKGRRDLSLKVRFRAPLVREAVSVVNNLNFYELIAYRPKSPHKYLGIFWHRTCSFISQVRVY